MTMLSFSTQRVPLGVFPTVMSKLQNHEGERLHSIPVGFFASHGCSRQEVVFCMWNFWHLIS